jgi:sec-independent protein translocase protein TatB
MEIFNIHIFEFLLIAGLALVVFGPERLPEVGRFVGKQVARFLAWQQQSPELQMLNDIRGEFEREIASLRDELTRTRKELDMQQEMTALRDELKPMLDLRNDINPPAGAATPASATADAAAPPAPAADAITPSIAPPQPADAIAQAAPEIRPAGQSVPSAARPNRIVAAEPTNVLQLPAAPNAPDGADTSDGAATPDGADMSDGAPTPDGADMSDGAPTEGVAEAFAAPDSPHSSDSIVGECFGPTAPDAAPTLDAASTLDANGHHAPPADAALLQRLDALTGELHALVALLRERGVLDDDWRAGVTVHDEESVS